MRQRRWGRLLTWTIRQTGMDAMRRPQRENRSDRRSTTLVLHLRSMNHQQRGRFVPFNVDAHRPSTRPGHDVASSATAPSYRSHGRAVLAERSTRPGQLAGSLRSSGSDVLAVQLRSCTAASNRSPCRPPSTPSDSPVRHDDTAPQGRPA